MAKKIRFTSFLIVCSLLLSMIAACSSNNEGNQNQETDNNNNEVSQGTADIKKGDVTFQFRTISLNPNFDDYINGGLKNMKKTIH